MDYGKVVSDALADFSNGEGGPHRAEALARASQALAYLEAARAVMQSHQRGFPLLLSSDKRNPETFVLGTQTPMARRLHRGTLMVYGPCVTFAREEGRLIVEASDLEDGVLDGPARSEWEPSTYLRDAMRAEVVRTVKWAVERLVADMKQRLRAKP